MAIYARTTLSEFKASGQGVCAHCEAPGLVCGHHRDLDIDLLIKRYGADFDLFNSGFAKRLRCRACGHKGAKLMIIAVTPQG